MWKGDSGMQPLFVYVNVGTPLVSEAVLYLIRVGRWCCKIHCEAGLAVKAGAVMMIKVGFFDNGCPCRNELLPLIGAKQSL